MPCPVSTYQAPRGRTLALFHSASSFAWVPESSPLDPNGARARAILRIAAGASPAPAVRAGSEDGPTSTKSLCITAMRPAPWPSRMNASSAAGECTSRTSASPRSPSSSACPDPTASVLTRQSDPRSNSGTRASRSPVSRVLVVVARNIVPASSLPPQPPGPRTPTASVTVRMANLRLTRAPRASALGEVVARQLPEPPLDRRSGQRVEQGRRHRMRTGPQGELELLGGDRDPLELRRIGHGAHRETRLGRPRPDGGRDRQMRVEGLVEHGPRVHPRLEQQPQQQMPRRRAGRAPCQPTAGEVRHAADPERVAAGHDQTLLTPPQVHHHSALAGKRRAHERVVEPAARSVAQMDRRGIGAATCEMHEAGDAAARPGHHGDPAAGFTQEQIERRIVAAGQTQHLGPGKPGACARGAAGRNHVASAVAPGDDAREAQHRVRPRRRAGRAARLARQLPDRGKSIAGCVAALGDVLRHPRCQLAGVHLYRRRRVQMPPAGSLTRRGAATVGLDRSQRPRGTRWTRKPSTCRCGSSSRSSG